MNFNEVTCWRNVVLETTENENQEKLKRAEMLTNHIPIDANFNTDLKDVYFTSTF